MSKQIRISDQAHDYLVARAVESHRRHIADQLDAELFGSPYWEKVARGMIEPAKPRSATGTDAQTPSVQEDK